MTITLAIGMARMAKRRAVIRRLPAVETLGSTTVICADKTGTLTENQMTVQSIWTPHGEIRATGTGYAPDVLLCDTDDAPVPVNANAALRWSLLAGACSNDAALVRDGTRWQIVGDPTEGAMLVVAAKAGFNPERLATTLPQVAAIPFSSERQYMATLHRDGTDHVVLAKGAVERMLDLCGTEMGADGALRPLDRATVLRATEMLTSRGLRVLATGMGAGAGTPDDFDENVIPGSLALTGLQAMSDPPRAAAASAVAACHSAGIAVKMITGDHAGTATAIATEVGLLDNTEPAAGSVLTGAELAALSADQYPEAVDTASVFARVSPEQKLRLVQALQARGHVVAMTGDGVNDAPALRQANIGVAMGRGGTEVAKDAADMVLTLPILPTQILWINMTTAIALGLMLAFEPKEAGIMTRPPRDPDQPLLTGWLVRRTLLVSTLLVASAWWLFAWELDNGAGLHEARTAALNLFVVVEAFYLFSCRSLTRSAWRLGMFANRWIILGVSAQAIAQFAITYLPAMNMVFDTAPIDIGVWVRIFAVATAITIVVATDTLLPRIRAQPP